MSNPKSHRPIPGVLAHQVTDRRPAGAASTSFCSLPRLSRYCNQDLAINLGSSTCWGRRLRADAWYEHAETQGHDRVRELRRKAKSTLRPPSYREVVRPVIVGIETLRQCRGKYQRSPTRSGGQPDNKPVAPAAQRSLLVLVMRRAVALYGSGDRGESLQRSKIPFPAQ